MIKDNLILNLYSYENINTQTKSTTKIIGDEKKTIIYMWPIKNPESIDSLRATVELPPLSWYLDKVKQTYGNDVIWDSSLTPDEVKAELSKND